MFPHWQVAVVNAQYQITTTSPYQVSNERNQLANGSCCLSTESPPQCNSCPNTRLRLCFRDERHSTDDRNSRNCPKGAIVTSINGGGSQRNTLGSKSGIYQVRFTTS